MTVAPLVASVGSFRTSGCVYTPSFDEVPPSTPTSCVDMLKEVAEGAVAGLLEDEEDHWTPETLPNNQRPIINSPSTSPTSVMLRNIPNKYTRSGLISALLDQGFDACKFCNNLYLPMDAGSGCNLGFCFLNFHRHEDAVDFMKKFEGCRLPSAGSRKVCSVVWANRQGVFQHSNPPGRLSDDLTASTSSSSEEGEDASGFGLGQGTNALLSVGSGGMCMTVGTPCKVFVGGLSATTTEGDLVNYFQQFGAVRECCIVTNRQTGTSRGFGFCEFVSIEAVQKVHAAQTKKPHAINGRVVSVRLYNFQHTQQMGNMHMTSSATTPPPPVNHNHHQQFYVF